MSWLRGVVALMLLATSAVVARAPEITGFEVNGSHGKLRIFIVSTSPVEYEVDESSNAMSLDVEVYPAVLGASARRVPGVPNELVRSATVRDLGGNRVRLSLRFAQPLRYEISPTGQGLAFRFAQREAPPAPRTIAATPAPVVVRPTPRPVVVRPTPRPVVVRPTPAPVVVRPTAAPVVVRPTPAPVVVRPTAAPVVVRPSPRPVVVRPTRTPTPVVLRPSVRPVASGPTPQPAVGSPIPRVRATSIPPPPVRTPVVARATATPVVVRPSPKPVAVRPSPKPVVVGPSPKPAATPKPAVVRPSPRPVAVRPSPRPVPERPTPRPVAVAPSPKPAATPLPVVAATPRPVRVAQVPRPAPAAPYARPHPRYEGGIPTYTNADLPPPRPTATPSPTVEEWPSATPTPAAKKPPVARKSPTPKPKPSPSPKESPFVFTSPNPEESPNAETIPADGETPAETDEAKALADLAPLPNKDVVDRIQWSPTSLERRQLEFLAFVAELPPPQTVTDRVAIENFATLADEGGTFTEQLQIAVVDMPVLDAAEATGVANDMLTARALRTASAGIAVTAGLASVSTPRGRSFIKQGMTTRRIFAGFVSSTSGFRSVPPTPTAMLVLLADAGLQAARQGRALQRDRQMRLLRELQRSPEAVTLPRVGTDRLRAR